MNRKSVPALVLFLLTAAAALAQAGGAAAPAVSVSAEALAWWTKAGPAAPPLISTGVLGQPGTRTVLGNDNLNTQAQGGLRVSAEYWPSAQGGFEASFLALPSSSSRRSVGSSGQAGSQDLFIPYFDASRGVENVTSLSQQGNFSGQATEELTSRFFGLELNALGRLPAQAGWTVDFLAGLRQLHLHENFTFATNSPGIVGPVDIFQTQEQFGTTNNFYGGQAGLRLAGRQGAWAVNGTLKLALGAMVQSATVNGSLLTNDFNGLGAPQTFAGGYFAEPTNIGRYRRTVLAAVPEAGLNVSYALTPRTSLVLGYTFLYASNVIRPGGEIDREVNPTQNPGFESTFSLVGPARPAFAFHSTNFWAQGLNAGAEFRF